MNPISQARFIPASIAQWDSTDVANPSSPYDSIGYYHNLILDYAATRYLASWNSDSVYNCVFNFYHDTWGTPIDTMRKAWAQLDSAIYSSNAADTEVVDSLITLLNTPEFMHFSQEAAAFVDYSGSFSRSAYLSGLIVIEDSVLASHTLNLTQKFFIGTYCAVGRYSYAYWHSPAAAQYPDITNKAGRGKGVRITATGSDVAKSDGNGAIGGAAAGFVSGGVGGAIWGSLGGPVGTLGGAAGGAIGGSMVAGLAGGATASIGTALGAGGTTLVGGLVNGLAAGLGFGSWW